MVKKRSYTGYIVILFTAIFMCACFLSGGKAACAKVKVQVKGDTVIVSGKGVLKSRINVKNPGRIKNVIVKKGVTALPYNAFSNFKRFDRVTIAPSVKTIGQGAFYNCKEIGILTIPGDFTVKEAGDADEAAYMVSSGYRRMKIGTVRFNTQLLIKNTDIFYSDNLKVMKKDKNYKSIDGVIYSKDGKQIVRVPARRKEIVVEDGCEEFCIASVFYCMLDSEGDSYPGCDVEKIVIPPSVKKVDDKKYIGISIDSEIDVAKKMQNPGEGLILNTESLDIESLFVLNDNFLYENGGEYYGCTYSYLAQRYPARLEKIDDMYIFDKKIILKYEGKAENVIIPDGITEIYKDAFSNNDDMKSITFPDSVQIIGAGAFDNCSGLINVNWGSGIRKIGKCAFLDCNNLKDIVIPDTVDTIEEGTYTGTGWTVLDIPEHVKYIGDSAFASDFVTYKYKRTVTIHGDSKNYADNAFEGYRTTLVFEKSDTDKYANWYVYMSGYYKEDAIKYVCNMDNRISDISGYQCQFSSSKNFKKNVKTVWIKKDRKQFTVKLSGVKKYTYGRVRPYTVRNNKKIYGRWVMKKEHNSF